MLKQIDAICNETGVLAKHAVLSGHAHNYLSASPAYTAKHKSRSDRGNGGHAVAKLQRKGGTLLRTPQQLEVPAGSDPVTLENYDDQDFGYLRVVVTPAQLRIESPSERRRGRRKRR